MSYSLINPNLTNEELLILSRELVNVLKLNKITKLESLRKLVGNHIKSTIASDFIEVRTSKSQHSDLNYRIRYCRPFQGALIEVGIDMDRKFSQIELMSQEPMQGYSLVRKDQYSRLSQFKTLPRADINLVIQELSSLQQ